jgi:hypothetical protein
MRGVRARAGVGRIDTAGAAASISRAVQREAIAERLRGWASSERRARAAWGYRLLLLVPVVASASFALRSVWSFTIDDAGISYAYAKHLAEGQGPVAVVGGPWVEGYSNPLWVLLLAALHVLGLDLPVAAKWLGAASFALGLGVGCAFVALASGRRPREPGAASACFAIVFALCLELVVWVPAGLENALFGALLLGLAFLDARESETPTAFAASGLAAFALSITRPEAAMYAAPLVLVKVGRSLARREPMRQARTATLLFVVPLALYHAGHYVVFGQLVANTYWAKPPDETWDKGLEYLVTTLRDSGLVYALPFALLGLYGKPRSKLLIAWAAVAGSLFVVYAGGDWMPNGRFLSLFAPALLALAALGLDRVARVVVSIAARLAGRASDSDGLPQGKPSQIGVAGALPREAIAFGLFTAISLGWFSYQRPRLARLERQGWCHLCDRIADTERVRQLGRRAALPSQSLVTHDFGGPAFLSEQGFYPLDFLGLCDRSAALLRHAPAAGSVGYDFRFYQYFIHEQPTAPSWVLLPPNFWPIFDRSLEAVLDYYPVPARLLPRARRDSFFVLHRGELLDYFPPLPAAAPRAVSESLALVGFAPFAVPPTEPADEGRPQASHDRLGPGARVLFVLSLVPRGPVRPGEMIGVRVEADGERAESALVPIDRGIDGLARALAPGEPLAIELVVELPGAPAPLYRISLAIHAVPGGKRAGLPSPTFVPIGELAAGTTIAAFERSLPRYPSALPAALDAELVEARPSVARVVEQSRRNGRSPDDAALSRTLIAQGERLEQDGDLTQAYLAYVWATQVRRRAWEELADRVLRLRQLALGDEHATELALLRRYYANGTTRDLERLTAYYLSLGRWLEADYFSSRLPHAGSGVAPETMLGGWREVFDRATRGGRNALASSGSVLERVAFDPLGGALDFEAEGLAGWEGEVGMFRAGSRPDRHRLPGLRGAHGPGVLSSRGGGDRGRGAVTSREFRLDGQVLSVLVAGGSKKRRVGVELLVDGAVAFTASGNDSDNLFPVFWDIAALTGRPARLRVFDENPRAHVVIDRVLIWR